MPETALTPKVARYAAEPVPEAPSMAVKLLTNLLPPILLGIGVLIAYALVRNSLPPHRQFLMPSASGLWELALGLPDFRRELLLRTGVTIGIALTGMAVTIPTAIILGIIMFRFFALEKAVFPFLVALQSVPVMAIIPLIQSALGFGLAPKVLIVVLFTFFAIPTTLLLGLKSVDKNILNLFRLQGASWWVMLRKACFPSAAPTLFAGLKISGSMAVIAAIVSELFFLAGQGGLGQLLMNSKIDFKYEQMYAALIASSILSISVYLFFNWLGNKLFSHWHESSQKSR